MFIFFNFSFNSSFGSSKFNGSVVCTTISLFFSLFSYIFKIESALSITSLGNPANLSPYMINSLYAVDRAIVWNKHLREQWERGNVILLDRYTTSSLIYQSALITDIGEKKAFIDYVCEFEYEKLGIGKPDDVIFLHAPFDLVTEMRNARKVNDGVANDIHERDLEFMKRVYESAMFVADYLGWSAVRCDKNDKMKSIEEIHEDVYKLVKQTLNKK